MYHKNGRRVPLLSKTKIGHKDFGFRGKNRKDFVFLLGQGGPLPRLSSPRERERGERGRGRERRGGEREETERLFSPPLSLPLLSCLPSPLFPRSISISPPLSLRSSLDRRKAYTFLRWINSVPNTELLLLLLLPSLGQTSRRMTF